MGQHCIHPAQEAFVLLYHVKLAVSTTESSNGFSQVLRKDLENSVGFFSADKDFADYTKKSRKSQFFEWFHLPFVLPLIILNKNYKLNIFFF